MPSCHHGCHGTSPKGQINLWFRCSPRPSGERAAANLTASWKYALVSLGLDQLRNTAFCKLSCAAWCNSEQCLEICVCHSSAVPLSTSCCLMQMSACRICIDWQHIVQKGHFHQQVSQCLPLSEKLGGQIALCRGHSMQHCATPPRPQGPRLPQCHSVSAIPSAIHAI